MSDNAWQTLRLVIVLAAAFWPTWWFGHNTVRDEGLKTTTGIISAMAAYGVLRNVNNPSSRREVD